MDSPEGVCSASTRVDLDEPSPAKVSQRVALLTTRRALISSPSASSWLHAEAQRGSVEDGYYVKSTFAEVPRQRITPLKHMGLRVMARLWGKRLIPVLKRRLIFVDRSGPGHFSRKINVEQGMLHIEDNLTVERESDQVYWADKYSLRHVASSKYHAADELSERSALEWRGKGTYCHIRRVDLRTGQVHLVEGNG